jgi:g-D-glutamyl-meso-diaminopimelate peptidase
MKKIYLSVLFIFWCFPLLASAQIVETDKMYTYEMLTEDLVELSQRYPNLITYKSITITPNGRELWAVKVGKGNPSILVNGAHHAREWMTSTLLIKMIATYAEAYRTNKTVEGFDPTILDEVSIWFVPMVNPDGVTLQQYGLDAFPIYLHPSLINMNEGLKDFRRWKANLNGIDLNRQYPANWGNLKGVNKKPNYQFYKGRKPLEADEVKALVDFTYEIKPEIAVSYHSTGNVLFWGFHQWGLTHTTEFTRDYYEIAEKVSELTRYKLEEPASHQQGGGYTDWFIQAFDKPALTVEIGSLIKNNSLPLEAFPDIWERNKTIGLFLAESVKNRYD